jgi:GNAT superfamily N-acetyltransferase
MVTDVRIVLATDHHVGGIVDRWMELMDYHRQLDPAFTRRPDGHLRFGHFLIECIDSDLFVVLAALDEDQAVLGYAVAKEERYPPVFERSRHSSLFDMAVHPDHQRRGIGTALLAAVEHWTRARGLTRLELRVSVHNPAGRAFWTRHGFADYLAVAAKEL